MQARGGHIVLIFAAALLLLAGCGGKKVIPADKLADIYADMFLADQWLRDHPDSRELADSTLFYDPIFERYGYSFEDFDHSMQYYTSVPDEFSEITTQVSEKLRKLGLRLDEVNKLRKETLAEYENVDFSSDSLWAGGRVLWPEEEITDSTKAVSSTASQPEDSVGMEARYKPRRADVVPALMKAEPNK